jgi:hypothetical protein
MRRTRQLVSLAIMVATLAIPASVCRAADDVAAAREHYAKGKRAYDLGRFAEAAKEYEAAYQAAGLDESVKADKNERKRASELTKPVVPTPDEAKQDESQS